MPLTLVQRDRSLKLLVNRKRAGSWDGGQKVLGTLTFGAGR
jgi:hypothetical protein